MVAKKNPSGDAAKPKQQQKQKQQVKAKSVPSRSKPKVGQLVTDEFAEAVTQCRAAVEHIAQECKAKNRKFRDIEFDLDNDKNLCLNGLVSDPEDGEYTPTGVVRVTDIYSNPKFFIDGAGSNDIVQGGLGDCWFLSALANTSHLVEQFCVARDEKVGVYGFVFFKNGSWVNVIIDDLLYVRVPKFEELSGPEQLLFHGDKRKYNQTARKGGKNLYFARSGTEDETWVPLIEKAYAKLHGDYSSLSGGMSSEAIEDLTGGVSSTIRIKDILDRDRFWKQELLKANTDRLFGAAYDQLDSTRSGETELEIEGLIAGHAYSVLKAVEVDDKRFLIVRNPWGQSEWKGPWSDGSKEWTAEWLLRLPEIGHTFGDDGQFLMEYSDFLENFEDIDRTLLFDASWKMSMEWLRVPVRPPPAAWSFGDVSFNFTVQEPTRTVIVLSNLDARYFKGVEGCYDWNLQFQVYKIDGEDATFVAESEQSVFANRSVNTETNLQPGDYAVHVRMEGIPNGPAPDPESFNPRKLVRVLTERSQARLIASNYDPMPESQHFPTPIDVLLERERPIAEARAKMPPKDAAAETEEAGSENEEGDDDDDEEGEKEEGDDGDEEGEKEEGDGSDDKKAGEEPDNATSEDSSESLEAFIGLRIYTQGGEEDIKIVGTIKEDADVLYILSLLDIAA